MRCPVCHRLVEGGACPRDGTALPEVAPPERAWPVPEGCAIERVLGVGGYAVVLAATWHGQSVAVKCALDGTDDRLAREARALARVAPPHVPRLIGSGPGYLVLERLAQPSLAQLIARGNTDVGEVARALFEAVAAVHAAGLVHGDLSPDNVFFDGRTATVIDFGLAHQAASEAALRMRTTDLGAGTLHYLAPEVLRGEPATAATDVYACGAMLYELVAGVPPFVGDATEIAHGIALLRPPPLPASPLAALIVAALDKDPASRPPAASRVGAGDLTPRQAERPPAAPVGAPSPAQMLEAVPAPPTSERVVLLGCSGVAIPYVERAITEAGGVAVRQRGSRTIAMFAPRAVGDPLAAALRAANALVERGGRCALHVAAVELAGARASGAGLDRLDWWPPGDARLHLTAEAAPLFEQDEPPLVGRAEVIDAVLAARDRVAATQRPAVVVLLGDRGTGRTRLATELRSRLTEANVHAVTSSHDAVRTHGAVGSSRDAVRTHGDDDAHASESSRDAVRTHGGDGAHASESSRDAVRTHGDDDAHVSESSRDAVRVHVIDDAHAADPIALAAIDAQLVRGEPVLVVALANQDLRELYPAWAIGVDDAVEVELGPLDAAAALELARHAVGDEFAPHALLAGLCELAAGHPKTLVDAARLAKLSGRAELPRAPAPGFLATEVLERLPAELARFAEVLALVGSALTPAELESIAGTRIDAGAAVLALASRGLARPRGAGWEVHPASLVTAIAQRIAPPEARRIHAAALAYLTARDGDRAERARHARGAGDHAAALELYEALVADANAAHDYLAAERWASSALDISAARDDRRARLLILRGAMRWRRHRIPDALADLDEALASGDARTAALADLEAGIALDWAGDYTASWDRARRAASVRDPDSQEIELGVRLAEGRHAFRTQRFVDAIAILRDVADRAVSAEQRVADAIATDLIAGGDAGSREPVAGLRQVEIVALCLLGPALAAQGELDEAERVFARALAACERAGDRIHTAVALANRSYLWSARRQPEAQRADLERCIRLARELGNPLVERVPAWNMAEMLYWEGRDAEALAYARRTAELAARFLEPVPEDALLAARIAVSRGDLATARERLAWIAVHCDPDAFQPVVRLLIAALRLVLDGDDAWDAVTGAADRELPEDELVEIWYLRARTRGDDAARARVRELAARWPIWHARAAAL